MEKQDMEHEQRVMSDRYLKELFRNCSRNTEDEYCMAEMVALESFNQVT